jgi:uncharacterized protein (TIGR02145 family)
MKRILLLFAGSTLAHFTNLAQTVTDVEGNIYPTVTIGTQVWMAANLKTTKYNDGTDIAYPGANNTSWQNNITGAFAWYNNDSVTYADTYGALYKWYTLNPGSNGGKNVCPYGWHVPTHNEWTTLERAICASASCTTDFPINLTTTGNRGTDEGGKLKESGSTHWAAVNVGATNSSGFTALPGGYRLTSGSYSGYETAGYWWSTTTDNSFTLNAWLRDLSFGLSTIERITFRKDCGLSVRCICDTLTTQVIENTYEKGINLFPNPIAQQLTIECYNEAGLQLTLFNGLGACVLTKTLDLGINTIDVNTLPKGLYVTQVAGKDWIVRKKMIKD